MSQPYVKSFQAKEVAHIEFFHPKHNSLTSHLLKKLVTAIEQAGKRSTVKVIVLRSGGDRSFCAGASFEEMTTITNEESGKAFFSGFANVINSIRKCPKLVIGRVQGKAIGGGVGLIAATDYCLATKHASIKLSELSIGIGPFVISPVIKRKIGISALTQISFESKSFFPPDWLRQKGLYNKVFENQEVLDLEIEKMAALACTYNLESVLEMKKIFWEGTENWDAILGEKAAISGRLALSETTKKKMNQFQKK